MRRLILLLAILLLPKLALGQVSGAGQLSCSGATTTGTAATSGTANNTVLANITATPSYGVLVQLDQTTTITGGAITFQISYDGGANYITVPVVQVLNPSTGAQLTNPYTLVASTNQAFLIVLSGASTFQVKLTTAITGSATVTPYLTPLCTQPTLGPLTLDANGNVFVNIKAQTLGKLLVTPDSVALPANQSVNVNQLAGTTTDTNSGNKSAGTLRVVLATDQPQPTNKFLVTPDALPANQSVNVSQFNGVTPLMGNGTSGTGAQRVAVASDNTPFETIPVTTATTTDAASTCYLTSAASTNSTSCKGSAGNVYGIYLLNTTTTNYFLRMYNSSAAPTCSSATGFIETIPALGASANGGGISRMQMAQGYGTGIGFCLTGGGSSTDNTNAATGVYITILYK